MQISTPHLILLFWQLSIISISQAQKSGTEWEITSSSFEKDFLPKRVLENNHAYNCTEHNCELTISAGTEYTLTLNSGSYFTGELFKASGEYNIVVSYDASPSSPYIEAGIFLHYKDFNSMLFDTPRVATWTVVIASYLTKSGSFERIEFIISNNSGSPTTIVFKISYAPADSDTSTFSVAGILIPIIVVAIAIFIAGCLLYLRRKRQNQLRRQREQRTRENDKQNSIAENDFLTVENLSDRFPEVKFSSLKSSFTQTTCSICIEDLDGERACRQLYCEHIFHSECIKLWINNELKKGFASCPNCKKDLMKKIDQI